MRFAVTVDIDAAAERVWDVMTDVERWPEWTASVARVERLDEGAFGTGSRARVEQPKLPPAVWTVTDYAEGSGFTWEAGAPGVKTTARHTIVPLGEHGSRVLLELESKGVGAVLLGPFIRGLSRRYVTMEAEGLKRRAEAPIQAAS